MEFTGTYWRNLFIGDFSAKFESKICLTSVISISVKIQGDSLNDSVTTLEMCVPYSLYAVGAQ